MQQLAKAFDNKFCLFIAFEVLCGNSMDAKAPRGVRALNEKVINSPKMQTNEALGLGCLPSGEPNDFKGVCAMVPKTSYDEDSAEKKDILSHYKHDVELQSQDVMKPRSWPHHS